VNNGSFWPSYILCSSVTTSDKRSGWRVVKQFDGKSHFNLPKVMVTSIYGHDDMLDYLALYRTQDTFKGIHYYPSGALCWFESNQYGEPIGSVYYARKIPDNKLLALPKEQRGYSKLKKQKSEQKKIKDLFAKERPDTIQFSAEEKKGMI